MTIGQKIDATLRARVTIDHNTDTATFDCQLCGQKVTHAFPVYGASPGEGLYIILAHLLVLDGAENQCPTVKQDGIESVVAAIVATDPASPGSLTRLKETREREARDLD